MFDGLYFEYPYLLVIFFIFIVCAKFCKMRVTSIYFPHTKEFGSSSFKVSKTLFLLKWLGIAMLVFSIMSPVKDELYQLKPKNGYEIAMVLDTSESMHAKGFDYSNSSLTRFDVVKELVSDFIKERKNDNIGLVVFGSYSFIASPLTYDKNILNRILSQLYIGMAGRYTALYEALAQGVNLLKNSNSKSKIMILLTDGYKTSQGGFPFDVALDLAKKEGVRVYPIGIGSSNGYNAKVLLKMAKETGGEAFGASSASELKEVYKRIDKLEKSKIKNESFRNLHYFYQYPLYIALISLMLYTFMRNKRG